MCTMWTKSMRNINKDGMIRKVEIPPDVIASRFANSVNCAPSSRSCVYSVSVTATQVREVSEPPNNL